MGENMQNPEGPLVQGRRFQTVASVARLLHISEVTIYRAIHAGEFPAIKVRGRYVIPTSVVDAMETAALKTGAMVDAADWVSTGVRSAAPSGTGASTTGRSRMTTVATSAEVSA
jgi:excisionase family DNA binding protein